MFLLMIKFLQQIGLNIMQKFEVLKPRNLCPGEKPKIN